MVYASLEDGESGGREWDSRRLGLDSCFVQGDGPGVWGYWIMRDLLAQYKECRDSNNWPGYGVNQLILNEWEVMGDE